MHYAVIIEPAVSDDANRREKLLARLRRAPGVLKVDEQLAGDGLVFADFSSPVYAIAAGKIEGVEAIEGTSVQQAITSTVVPASGKAGM